MKRLLPAMFGIGVLSVLVQVTLLREMLVVFFGNELCYGSIMASWLLGVGAGACGVRVLRRDSRFLGWTRHLLTLLPLAIIGMLPVQIWVLRGVRGVLGVGPGEYAPLGSMLAVVALVCLPCCSGVGAFFPLACEWSAVDRRRVDRNVPGTVARLYACEAVGSMLGGVLLTFVLLPTLTPLQVSLVAVGVGLLTASAAAPSRSLGWLIRSLLVPLVALVLLTDLPQEWEAALIRRRWQAFGVLGGGGADTTDVRLVGSQDTVYGNLALTESHGQYALYENGKLAFVFPDEIEEEHAIHSVMGMAPDASRVLVLGGNPIGVIPQMLKYPVAEVVFVELDPGAVALMGQVAPGEVASVFTDVRVTRVIGDGVRFVQRDKGPFDLVLVNAPEPSTFGANRFYTVEFYESLKRILSPNGIVVAGVAVSVRLQSESQAVGGAVYQALAQVFPVVKATAGQYTRFFAGGGGTLPDGSAQVTFDRKTLYRRSRSARIETHYFRPDWFRGADDIAPDKTARVEQRFRDAVVAKNRIARPTACLANMRLWDRFSGSRMERAFGLIERIRFEWVKSGLLFVGALLAMVGLVLRSAGGERSRDFWVRCMSSLFVATIGFFSMSMHVLLVMVFQGWYGTVYTRMGLIVAAFMLGLVIGAPTGRLFCRHGTRWHWVALAGVSLVLLVMTWVVPRAMARAYGAMQSPLGAVGFETGFYMVMTLLGWLTGAAFSPATLIFNEAGGSIGHSAAVTDAADHLGAALGAVLVGVVLLPVLGVDGACGFLAVVMLMSLLLLGSGLLCRQ